MATTKTNSKFMAPITPDTVLSEIIGTKPVPRTEIVKKLWAYIKKNNLQDKKNKRNINADEKLLKFFGGKKQVTMFDLAKFISKHAK
jgi:chromatin remodeling complex protein RSC6